MQIGSSTISPFQLPATYRRDELAERRKQQSDQAAAVQPQPAQSQVSGEVTRIRPRPSVAAQRADQQSPRFANSNTSSYARNAVSAYSSNGPSIAERLGVELVGVDTYA